MSEWLKNQQGKAKLAWSIVLILAAIFGYDVTLNKVANNEDVVNNVSTVIEKEVVERLKLVQKNLDELNKIEEIQKIEKNENFKSDYEKIMKKYED